MKTDINYKIPNTVGFNISTAFEELSKSLYLCMKDQNLENDKHTVEYKIENGIKYLLRAKSELNDKYDLDETICEFGSNFHTMLRKYYIDDKSASLLWGNINTYSGEWSAFLLHSYKLYGHKKYTDTDMFIDCVFELSSDNSSYMWNEYFNICAAFDYFFKCHTLEEVKTDWNKWNNN
jgi:hypothetical protein